MNPVAGSPSLPQLEAPHSGLGGDPLSPKPLLSCRLASDLLATLFFIAMGVSNYILNTNFSSELWV